MTSGKQCKIVLLLATVGTLLNFFAPASAQETDLKREQQRAASIASMENRIAQIEREIKAAESERAQELGEDVSGLLGQIDDTYMQLKNSYQRQVVGLNQLMQRLWKQAESAEN